MEQKAITEQKAHTPTLTIGYASYGAADGTPIILLHGFPDDIHAWDAVAPPLAAAGFRVLVPYLRGFGSTRFNNPETLRSGQQAALAQDLLDFMDALGLKRAGLAGYDWGGRAACIASILAPERVLALVTIGGYNVQNTLTPAPPRTALEERALWYQWYFNTERGRMGLKRQRREIGQLLWREWSPTCPFDNAVYERTADAFDNPDFVPTVIHSYRHRYGNAPGESRFDKVEQLLATRPPIEVLTMVLHGAEDAVSPPSRSESQMGLFPAGTERRVIAGAGHFMPREKPLAIIEALLRLLQPHCASRQTLD